MSEKFETREELCKTCALLFARKLVNGNEGNASARAEDGSMLVTPSGLSKGFLSPEHILRQSFDGKVLEGIYRPTKEAGLHAMMYKLRPDVNAVLHTHPAASTAFAALGRTLPRDVLIEVPLLLGQIALVPYAEPGSRELLEGLARFADGHNIFFLQNHGVVVCGDSLQQAFDRMDALENAARTIIYSRILDNTPKGGTPVKTLAVIHTTPATITSLSGLAKDLDSHVTVRNFLDDSILPEIIAAGAITPAVRTRFYNLAQTAAMIKPDALLCACSSVGGLLEECREFLTVPAFRIDEPMAEKAVNLSSVITVAATLSSTLEPTMDLIRRKAKAVNKTVTLTPILIEGAGALMAAGRMEEYRALIAFHLTKAAKDCGVIVLAQASMASAAEGIEGAEVLSSPQSGMAAALSILQ